MPSHAVEYVRTRTSGGTLSRNLPSVEEALRRREADGYRLVSALPETDNGDLTGVLLLMVQEDGA